MFGSILPASQQKKAVLMLLILQWQLWIMNKSSLFVSSPPALWSYLGLLHSLEIQQKICMAPPALLELPECAAALIWLACNEIVRPLSVWIEFFIFFMERWASSGLIGALSECSATTIWLEFSSNAQLYRPDWSFVKKLGSSSPIGALWKNTWLQGPDWCPVRTLGSSGLIGRFGQTSVRSEPCLRSPVTVCMSSHDSQCLLFSFLQEMIVDKVNGQPVPRYLIYDIIKFNVSSPFHPFHVGEARHPKRIPPACE